MAELPANQNLTLDVKADEEEEEELSLYPPTIITSSSDLQRDSGSTSHAVSSLDIDRVRKWNGFFCIAYIAMTIAIVISVGVESSSSPVVEVMIPLYESDSTITVPTPHRVGLVNVFWLLPVFNFIATIHHFIGWQRLKDTMIAQQLQDGTHLLQWIEYSLSNSIMIMMVALLIGITDLFTIMGLWGLIASSTMTWFAVEEISNPVRKEIVFAGGAVAQTVVLISLAIIMFSGIEYLPQSTIGAFAVVCIFHWLCGALVYCNQFERTRQVNATMRSNLGGVLNRPQPLTVQQLHALASQATNEFDIRVRKNAHFSILFMWLAFTSRLWVVLGFMIGGS